VTPSATSENNLGVIRLIANLPFYRRFLRPPSTEAPSLPRNYPASSVLPASPPSQSARPVSHELPVDPKPQSPLGLPVLRMVHCACMPSPIPRQVGWNLFARTIPFASAFPETGAGRLLHYAFRGLLSVYSRYGLHARRVANATFYTEGFSSFVASAAASIATGWSEPVPGRVSLPLWTTTFHGAPGYAVTGEVALA